MFGKRPDGVLAENVPAYRRMMPYLMTSKNTSTTYSKFFVNVEKALEMIENPPEGFEGKLTITHLFLRATTKILAEYPRLNRFVSGRKIYQRDGIYLSFSAKKAFRDDAPVIVIKMRFDPNESLQEMSKRVLENLKEGRSDKESTADKETNILLKLPGPLLRMVIWLVKRLDNLNLLPKKFIESDLFHASAFIANVGSLGLDAAYHHLYEYGNIPLFGVIGKIQPMLTFEGDKTVVRKVVEVKVTFDERVDDGFYAARALVRYKQMLENPTELL